MATTDPSTPFDEQDSVLRHVPMSLRIASAWSWRLIVVAIVVSALVMSFSTLAPVLLPMVIALLIAAPLERFVTFLHRYKIPRSLGAVIAILLLIGFVLGMSTAAGAAVIAGFEELRVRALDGINQVINWLAEGPLDLSRTQLNEGIDNVVTTARENAWGLASGALSVTGAVGGLFAGLVISIIALFFFLRDGRKMWVWVANLLPGEKTTHRVDHAGTRAWTTLRRYAQTVIVVALVNAVGIGGVAWLLGVPLVIPIAIFVFLTAFIPLLGATLAGVVAVLIALVDGGLTTAAFMLAGVLVVQQVEGNVLYPWLFGKAASIHPFAILVTISAGTLTAGLVGAVIAVPILAFLYTFAVNLKDPEAEADEDKPITEQIPVMARKSRDAIRGAMHRSTEVRVRRKGKRADTAPADGDAPEGDAKTD